MTQLLTIGKYYNLSFTDEKGEVEEYINGLKKLSSNYKLIGEGMIPWGDKNINKCEEYKYYLFKNCYNDNIIEIAYIKETNEYLCLVFFGNKGLTTSGYSDYLDYGSLDFPEFCGNQDINVNVDIIEINIE